MLDNNNDINFDRRHIWHPYTSMTNPLPVYKINSARSYKLILDDGRQLIDGMSSWWSAIHGYNHPIINKAMIRQIKTMSHVMFGGITHTPAIELCRRLLKLLPKSLECIFLADSGSVAIEIAIKMALQYWYICSQPKKKFLSLYYGYHGDTIGALSVCDPNNSMHYTYCGYIPSNLFVSVLKKRFGQTWTKEDGDQITNLFVNYHNELAAVILEPIVQGAGGMNFYHPEYLKLIRSLCDYYNVLMIVDEIATGFGRTGKLFACNYVNVIPDIICIGKALTGGNLTLSATVTNRKIAEVISNGKSGCFMHGPTFMGNPLACAAANANLKLLEKGNWNLQVEKIYKKLYARLMPLVNHSKVKDVRVLGAIGVIETNEQINVIRIQRWFVNQGVWIRPFKNLIYIMPPYIISSSGLNKLINAMINAIEKSDHFIS